MVKLKEFADSVSKEVDSKLDPATIVIIINIIVQVIKFIYEHKKSVDGTLTSMRSSGVFDRLMIQSRVMKRLRGKAYSKYGHKIVEAIISRSQNLSATDLEKMLSEIDS